MSDTYKWESTEICKSKERRSFSYSKPNKSFPYYRIVDGSDIVPIEAEFSYHANQ